MLRNCEISRSARRRAPYEKTQHSLAARCLESMECERSSEAMDSNPAPAEASEERERERAAGGERALVEYLRKWERSIERLQRAHPERWRVAGLSVDEVRDALTLHLLEVVRDRALWPAAQAGKPWPLVVVRARLAELRRSFRLSITAVDFGETVFNERTPNQEERWLELESAACRAEATRNACAGLSRPQRRWLDAMTEAARNGEFFAASDELNLSAASRLLGKHRSSALRAYNELSAVFASELERMS
jgi:hypothetical protein